MGKTTLCNALIKAWGLEETAHVTEVARKVMADRGYTRNDVPRIEMQRDIMLAHIHDERRTRADTPGLVLCDRSAIDPVVYSILTSSDEQNAHERRDQLIQMDEFQYILPFYRQSLFLLLEPVEEWVVDDGIRMIEHLPACFKLFQATLRSLGIEYHVIGKDTKPISERVAVVTKLVGF